MDRPSFEEAKRIAEQYRERALPDAERYRTASADRRQKVLPSLIRDSAWDWMAWDAVKLIAEQLRRRGEPRPAELNDWAVDAVTEIQPRPKQRPGRPRERERDNAIVDAIKELEAKGYRPTTRNIETDQHVSACDAVAEAFSFGIQERRARLVEVQEVGEARDTRSSVEIARCPPS